MSWSIRAKLDRSPNLKRVGGYTTSDAFWLESGFFDDDPLPWKAEPMCVILEMASVPSFIELSMEAGLCVGWGYDDMPVTIQTISQMGVTLRFEFKHASFSELKRKRMVAFIPFHQILSIQHEF